LIGHPQHLLEFTASQAEEKRHLLDLLPAGEISSVIKKTVEPGLKVSTAHLLRDFMAQATTPVALL
jgi:hypothetical protein